MRETYDGHVLRLALLVQSAHDEAIDVVIVSELTCMTIHQYKMSIATISIIIGGKRVRMRYTGGSGEAKVVAGRKVDVLDVDAEIEAHIL